MIYEYKNKYYIKLYPSVYREIKVNLKDNELVIEAGSENTEISDEKSVKSVSTTDIKNKLKRNDSVSNTKNKKYYK